MFWATMVSVGQSYKQLCVSHPGHSAWSHSKEETLELHLCPNNPEHVTIATDIGLLEYQVFHGWRPFVRVWAHLVNWTILEKCTMFRKAQVWIVDCRLLSFKVASQLCIAGFSTFASWFTTIASTNLPLNHIVIHFLSATNMVLEVDLNTQSWTSTISFPIPFKVRQ